MYSCSIYLTSTSFTLLLPLIYPWSHWKRLSHVWLCKLARLLEGSKLCGQDLLEKPPVGQGLLVAVILEVDSNALLIEHLLKLLHLLLTPKIDCLIVDEIHYLPEDCNILSLQPFNLLECLNVAFNSSFQICSSLPSNQKSSFRSLIMLTSSSSQDLGGLRGILTPVNLNDVCCLSIVELVVYSTSSDCIGQDDLRSSGVFKASQTVNHCPLLFNPGGPSFKQMEVLHCIL